MTTLLATIHVCTAIVAFGPTFAFPFIGAIAEREPAFGNVLSRAVYLVATRLVIPVGLTQAVTGILLILNLHLDLTKNSWLGIGIILYIAAMLGAIFHQLPTTRKIIEMTDPKAPSPPSMVALRPLVNRVKFVGMALTTTVLVIAVLMVWKPGFTASY